MTPPRLLGDRRGWLFTALVGASLLQAIGFAGTALATRSAFGALSSDESIARNTLIALAASAALVAMMQMCFRVLADAIGERYAKSVRLALFAHASASAQPDIDRRRRGYVFMRFIGDLSALKQWPGLGLPRLVQAMVVLPCSVTILFLLHQPFGWISLGIIGLVLLAVSFTRAPLLKAHKNQRAQRARIAADMAERMPLAPQLKAAQRQARETTKLSNHADRLAALAVRRRSIAEALKAIPDMSAGLAAALFLAIGANQNLGTGTVAGALAALALTITPLRNLMALTDKAAAFQAAHQKLQALLERPTILPDVSKRALPKGPLSLELHLPGQEQLIIQPGDHVALTPKFLDHIAPLLTGLCTSPEGQILVSDRDVGDINVESLGRRVAIIDDSPLVLKGSLRRALALGLRQRPSDEQMLQRLEKVGLIPILQKLGGLDRRLAESGSDFSPSERIELAALRAAVLRPGLLLLRHGHDNPQILSALKRLRATLITASIPEEGTQALAWPGH